MALSSAKISDIRQAKMNALAARYLHEKRRAAYKPWIQIVDFLTLGIPGFYIIARLLAKGTGYADPVEHTWEFLSGALILLGFWKMARGWGDQAEKHRFYSAKNIDMVATADSLLAKTNTLSNDNADWFLRRAADFDAEDREVLRVISDEEMQEAFRNALKQFTPATAATLCPQCHANPWAFQPGACQMCGGTPVPPPSLAPSLPTPPVAAAAQCAPATAEDGAKV